MNKRLIIPVVALTTLAACGDSYNDKRGKGDAPVGDTDDSPAQVVNFPNEFHNVAFKCLGLNGIYTHTREAAPVVIANDPNCAGNS